MSQIRDGYNRAPRTAPFGELSAEVRGDVWCGWVPTGYVTASYPSLPFCKHCPLPLLSRESTMGCSAGSVPHWVLSPCRGQGWAGGWLRSVMSQRDPKGCKVRQVCGAGEAGGASASCNSAAGVGSLCSGRNYNQTSLSCSGQSGGVSPRESWKLCSWILQNGRKHTVSCPDHKASAPPCTSSVQKAP